MIKVTFADILLQPVMEKRNSSDNAFCINDEFYSYSQLYDVVEQIWHKVADLQENLIGLYATDDIRTYASILALWACGKTYVPLNPTQPKERHAEVMRSVKSSYILTSDDKYDITLDGVEHIVTSGILSNGYERQNDLNLASVSDSELAYILFTSGSTGTPKGVQITRGNVAAFIDSMNNIGLEIKSNDRCLQPFDLTFDFSVSGYVVPLSKGACIYTIPNKAIKFTYIAGLLEDHKLTVLQMVPSMVRSLMPYIDEVELDSVRYNIFCGEALTGKIIKGWHKANPKMESYNMYGPTEDTVFCTYYSINADNIDKLLESNDVVGIGKTFRNSGLLLIDDDCNPISQTKTEGELCLRGEQLTPGYWQNEKENEEKFFNLEGERYYKTGDICFYDEDYNLLYVSRKDFQVKVNGFRVELGEIENRYAIASGGRFAVVIPYTNEQGNTELALVVEGESYDYNKDKQQLSNVLPAYEIPTKWLFMPRIPLNANGKLDRKEIKKHFNLK